MRVVLLLLLCLLTTGHASAADDIQRPSIKLYLAAFSGETDEHKQMRYHLFNYLAGIRDHLWWQCQYDVTVSKLYEGAKLQIDVARMTKSEFAFKAFAAETAYGDMVFISLYNEDFYGKPKPCAK